MKRRAATPIQSWRLGMHRVVNVVAAAAAVLLLPSVLFAQAIVAGVVRDASAAVLPGVTVEAASPVLIEKTRTVVSDNTGQYRLTDLLPGARVRRLLLWRYLLTWQKPRSGSPRDHGRGAGPRSAS